MRVFIIVLLLIVSFAVPAMAAEKTERKVLYWYDPMVPGQKFEHGGKSPFMDMDLVPFYEDEAKGEQAGQEGGAPDNAVFIDARYRQALGVKSALVEKHEFGKAVHAYGHIEPSTRLEHTVAVRTAGWIVDLKTDAVGDAVAKNDLLFSFYSPDLMTAQTDFLIGNRMGNSEQRLRLNGMDEPAIAALKKSGKFLEETPFHAPAAGTVSKLNIRKGAYVKEGETILTLQDYSKVWVTAHVPLRDLPLMKVGAPAKVMVDETGEHIGAVIDYIYPMTDPQSREGMVRIELDNADGGLKTDMLVSVMFDVDRRERLAVPEEAVMSGGSGSHVIEDIGDGYFRPVMVKTGITAQGMTEITSGIAAGKKIVKTGQFMIDSESNLRGGMAAMEHEHAN